MSDRGQQESSGFTNPLSEVGPEKGKAVGEKSGVDTSELQPAQENGK